MCESKLFLFREDTNHGEGELLKFIFESMKSIEEKEPLLNTIIKWTKPEIIELNNLYTELDVSGGDDGPGIGTLSGP